MVNTTFTYCEKHGEVNCGCVLADRYELTIGGRED